nr:hypothetical protein [Escherichia coli]
MVVQECKPLREFFHDRHASSTITTGKCRTGKPKVIRATTTDPGAAPAIPA